MKHLFIFYNVSSKPYCDIYFVKIYLYDSNADFRLTCLTGIHYSVFSDSISSNKNRLFYLTLTVPVTTIDALQHTLKQDNDSTV